MTSVAALEVHVSPFDARPAANTRPDAVLPPFDPLAAAPNILPRVAHASVGQSSLWFLRQVMPHKTAYNIAVQFRLSGSLDADALQAALRAVVDRHESLRTTFCVSNGVVSRVIAADTRPDMSVIDLAPTSDPDTEAHYEVQRLAEAPLDLERGPLFRARLFRLTAQEHVLAVVVDHIVADGMSLGILWREVEEVYRAVVSGQSTPLLPPVAHDDLVVTQDEWLKSPAFARQLVYLRDHLAGCAPSGMPTDRPRPVAKSYRGGLSCVSIPSAVVARIRARAAAEEVSFFSFLLAALSVLVARYSGNRDTAIMVPFACRQRPGTEAVVGFCSNLLALRTEVDEASAVGALLRRVNAALLQATLRQDVPFEKVIEALRPDRSRSHNPLAQIALSFLPATSTVLDLPGVRATYAEVPNGGSKFDLYFTVTERATDLSCSLEYDSDLFEADTAARLLRHYGRLLGALGDDSLRSVAELPILSDEELHRMLQEWNRTHVDYLRPSCLQVVIHDVTHRAPRATAASFNGDSLTYEDLDRRSSQVARSLRARGVFLGKRVGVAVERSLDMLIGLLGILKAGGTYVPLDPAYPRQRLQFIVEDAELHALVAHHRFADLWTGARRQVLCLDTDRAEILREATEPLEWLQSPEAVAYVIYTSGSTGKPKGVEITHRSLLNFLGSMAREPGLEVSDRLLAVTSISFDIAGLELWLPLTVGAEVEIASHDIATDGRRLRDCLDAHRVTVLQATPATFRLLLDAGWKGHPGLKVLVGGEALAADLADKLLDRAGSVWNMYGPTETTVWSCIQRLAKGTPVLIGRPIANTQAYILDQGRSPVPIGVTGELFLGGDGVAKGYLNRPELTQERFVPNPFARGPQGRLYRTGDLCRYRADGSIEFLGRADFQVKVRGYRIELGEVEAALLDHPSVREAAALVREEAPGNQTLVAYVVLHGEGSVAGVEPGDTGIRVKALEAKDLRAHLRAKLPEYMVPSQFLAVDRFPLTANKKVDRRALPRPSAVGTVAVFSTPRVPTEARLRTIWEEVLGVKGIGIHDGFFDLGGHSLLALHLFDRVEKSFGIRMPVASIFEASTIELMAEVLRKGGIEPRWTSLVAMSPGGSKPPFFCVHGGGALVLFYYPMAKHLGPDQPFYGLQPASLSVHDVNHPHTRSVGAMAAHYLEELREVQPTGPYYLGGASYGGMIALEMAQQLQAVGEKTALLAMFDTYGPGYYPPRSLLQTIGYAPLETYLRIEHHAGSVWMLPPDERAPYLRSKWQKAVGEYAQVLGTWKRELARDVFARMGRNLPRDLVQARNAVNEAIARYAPRPYDGKITLFRGSRQAPGARKDPTLGWGPIARGGLEIRTVPGYHAAMISEPRVRFLVPELAQCLEKARAE